MSAPTRRGRAGWAWLLAAAGLVLIAVLGGRPSEEEPFDPRAAAPTGTKALIVLLDELGAEVTITDEVSESADVIAIVRDGSSLSDGQLETVDDSLRRGTTVVVTDPFSPLSPTVAGPLGEDLLFSSESTVSPESCTIDPLAGVGAIDVLGAYAYDTEGTTASCYGDDAQAFVTVTERERGNVVAFGGTTPFTNELLGQAANAAVIASLLVPDPGTELTILEDEPVAAASDSVADSPFDLVDSSVVQAVVQLGIAFLVYALWRARRLGRPLGEPQPVDIAGSELVAAVGDLLHRTDEPRRAAHLLRDDTRRTLCERLGLPPESPVETVAAAVADRTGIEADRVSGILSTAEVATDDELVSLSRDIESLRQEILHEHPV